MKRALAHSVASGGGRGSVFGKRESEASTRTRAHKTHAHTHTHTSTVIAGAIQEHSAALRGSRGQVNGGCGIRVNLLGPDGPGFVSKPHFGVVEGNGNDMRAKQGKQSLYSLQL